MFRFHRSSHLKQHDVLRVTCPVLTSCCFFVVWEDGGSGVWRRRLGRDTSWASAGLSRERPNLHEDVHSTWRALLRCKSQTGESNIPVLTWSPRQWRFTVTSLRYIRILNLATGFIVVAVVGLAMQTTKICSCSVNFAFSTDLFLSLIYYKQLLH